MCRNQRMSNLTSKLMRLGLRLRNERKLGLDLNGFPWNQPCRPFAVISMTVNSMKDGQFVRKEIKVNETT